MRKELVAFAAASLGCSFAQAGFQQITNKTISADYTNVITEAFTSAPTVKCIDEQGKSNSEAVGFIAKQLRQAEEVWVDPSGAQPALLIVAFGPGRKTRYTTRITTSSDRKDVVALTGEYAEFERVNKGNLVTLKMVEEYVPQATVSCDTR